MVTWDPPMTWKSPMDTASMVPLHKARDRQNRQTSAWRLAFGVILNWWFQPKNMKVSWNDYSQHMKKLFQTTNNIQQLRLEAK